MHHVVDQTMDVKNKDKQSYPVIRFTADPDV